MTANEAVAGTKVMLVAALAVVANEELTELDAQLEVPSNVPVNEPVKLPVLICTELDTTPLGNMVGANEALTATLELCAQLAVPVNVPTNEPVNDPVLI